MLFRPGEALDARKTRKRTTTTVLPDDLQKKSPSQEPRAGLLCDKAKDLKIYAKTRRMEKKRVLPITIIALILVHSIAQRLDDVCDPSTFFHNLTTISIFAQSAEIQTLLFQFDRPLPVFIQVFVMGASFASFASVMEKTRRIYTHGRISDSHLRLS